MILIDRKFRKAWKAYLLQSFYGACVVCIILVVLNVQHLVVIASLGASCFIVFAMPNNVTAKPRNVIGGHLVGLICGSLFSLIPHPTFLISVLVYSLAIGASIFIMVVTDTEHPPASGTALEVVISGFSLGLALTILVFSVTLSLAHHFLKRYIKDLV
ncbi:HPP family protein [candidate division WOR-3 bacterium]|nr:HPP family protein [candidate division WOR-3 bacterium]